MFASFDVDSDLELPETQGYDVQKLLITALNQGKSENIIPFDSQIEITCLGAEQSKAMLSATANHPPLVLRIGLENNPSYGKWEKEKWALKALRDFGIPAAKLIGEGTFPVEGNTFRWSVLERLPGFTAMDLGADKRKRVFEELGVMAWRIHQVTTTGAGTSFSKNAFCFPSAHSTWNKAFESLLAAFEQDLNYIEGLFNSPDDFQRFKRLVELEMKREFKPALIHNNLQLSNVLVNEQGKISGLLDLANCLCARAPEMEFACLLNTNNNVSLPINQNERRAFLRGYGLSWATFQSEMQHSSLIWGALGNLQLLSQKDSLHRRKLTRKLIAAAINF